MIKILRFSPDLVPLILSGQKTSTWRIWDDKDLKKDDQLGLLEKGSDKRFAYAIITSVIEKKMGELTDEDRKGHEEFEDDKQMYKTYSDYYQKEVNSDTMVKIIRFNLLHDLAQ